MGRSRIYYPYKLAKVVEGSRLYVEFWAWHVKKNRLTRKRLYKFEGKNKTERLNDAERQARILNRYLAQGYVMGGDEKQDVIIPHTLREGIARAIEIQAPSVSQRTREINLYAAKRLTDYLDSKGMDPTLNEIGRTEMILFLDYLVTEKGLSNTTRNNTKDRIKAFFSMMKEREWIEENPMKGIKNLRTRSKTHTPFTDDQRERLEAWLKENDPNIWVFTQVIYYSFLRPVEITRLKVSDLNLQQRRILVKSTQSKSGKQQPVYITPSLKAILQEYLDNHKHKDEWYLFGKGFKPGWAPVGRQAFTKRHRKALKATGIWNNRQEYTGYAWKHTGVCKAYNSGIDIKTIQEQCRHSSLQQTETYLRALGLRMSRDLKEMDW